MARYFFDITDAAGSHSDPAGDDFATVDDARQHCQAVLADMIGAELPDGDHHEVRCDLRDEAGRVVYSGEITFHGAPRGA